MKITLSLFFMVSLAAVGCAAPNTAKRPNVVFINAEDISPAIGAYGDDYATTPNLDRMAQNGVLYKKAYATAPICSPSRSALATGMYATALGTQHLRSEVELSPKIKTAAHYMREAGYFTTLHGKTDYNFDPEGVWDLWTSKPAPWRQRPKGSRFYSFMTLGHTHEGAGNNLTKYQSAIADLPKHLLHDPAKVIVPPFFPDTTEIRSILANYNDLITTFDMRVGEVLDLLKEDGLLDETIVFVFSDHGYGLPRYKRWLNHSGVWVPLIVHVPEQFRHLAEDDPGSVSDRMVSFADFVPTALNLAGAPIPEHMPGKPFMGKDIAPRRDYVFHARSRADDMYDISRSVHDGRYFYARHYLPQLPYIQPGLIFGNQKRTFKELRRVRELGQLPPAAEAMFRSKPVEELYDIENDPFEVNNLANDPEFAEVKTRLKARMRQWIVEHRDAGFLLEPEMYARGTSSSIYDMAQDSAQYDLETILDAAEKVGDASVATADLQAGLGNPDSGVRFWSVMALQARGIEAAPDTSTALAELLDDPSETVRVAAAETLCQWDDCSKALQTLDPLVQSEEPRLALYAARALSLLGASARPLVDTMRAVIEKNRSAPGAKRAYKDFVYASFTGWTLEHALQMCGEPVEITVR